MQTIATDLDGMLFAFPTQIAPFLTSLQKQGYQVGILTARSQTDQEELLRHVIEKSHFVPDFLVCKSNTEPVSDGLWKGQVCREFPVDILFDDFEASDPRMIADFFSVNTNTLALTSWAYQP